jgi:hypothetical protein
MVFYQLKISYCYPVTDQHPKNVLPISVATRNFLLIFSYFILIFGLGLFENLDYNFRKFLRILILLHPNTNFTHKNSNANLVSSFAHFLTGSLRSKSCCDEISVLKQYNNIKFMLMIIIILFEHSNS